MEGVSADVVTLEDGRELIDFVPAAGVMAPQSYLVIVTAGLAPAVKVTSLALLAEGEIGDEIALSVQGT